MKLLTKTNLYYLVILLAVFTVGGVLFYFSLLSVINENTNERLQQEKLQVTGFIKNKDVLPENVFMLADSLTFVPVTGQVKEQMKDTFLMDNFEGELIPYRMLLFPVSIGNDYYQATIFKPTLESDDLVESIISTIGWILAILIAMLLLFNYFFMRNAWAPFYSTLERLRSFELSRGPVEFERSTTREFQELNTALEQMTSKIVNDYRNMKEFTENASHETQTPLAIIRSRLELMIQSGKLDEKQMKEIQVIYESATRLSKLNQALLLLTKIENNQFTGIQPVNIKELIEKKLNLFDDLILHKEIRVQRSLQAGLIVPMNPILADILISNLLSNAIKHNIRGGELFVETSKDTLTISNSGLPLKQQTYEFFQRFRKANPSSDSLGLGLAIVKQICSSYAFTVQYNYTNDLHEIRVNFTKQA
ncbi:MAG: HAMP domain-containing histidine kinase [Bacteroidetes bacterium]|nr:HAMP domain-containing histidine kinase [Bacteroidota bacterium]